jgi:hypothetical protein
MMVQPTAALSGGFTSGSAEAENEPLSNVLRLVYTSNFIGQFQIRQVCFIKKKYINILTNALV